MENLSEEQKKTLAEFQAYQQQLQTVLLQKESMKMQKMDAERALDELKKIKETTAYKIVANVMIKKPVKELISGLEEQKEALEARTRSLEKIEEKIKKRLNELQSKLKEWFGG